MKGISADIICPSIVLMGGKSSMHINLTIIPGSMFMIASTTMAKTSLASTPICSSVETRARARAPAPTIAAK
jgi:hypothetical protein